MTQSRSMEHSGGRQLALATLEMIVMKKPSRRPVFAAFVALLLTSTGLFASVGRDFRLVVDPDQPGGGDRVKIEMSDGREGDFVFFFAAVAQGSFPFGELKLGLDRPVFFPIGLFPRDGTISLQTVLPDPMPPELVDVIVYMQAASVGPGKGRGDLHWRASNLDRLQLKD